MRGLHLILSEKKFVSFTLPSVPLGALGRALVMLRYCVVSGRVCPVACDVLMACSRPARNSLSIGSTKRGWQVTAHKGPGALASRALTAAGCAASCVGAAGYIVPVIFVLDTSPWWAGSKAC